MYDFINKVLEINGRRDVAYSKVQVGKENKPIVSMREIDEADYKEYETITDELKNFLLGLEYDEIKLLETIMLLGRDGKKDEKLRGRELLDSELEYMNNFVGWHGKEREIDYILEKSPLNDYLTSGMSLLGTI